MYYIDIGTKNFKTVCKGDMDMAGKIGKVLLVVFGTVAALVAAFYFIVLLTAWLAPLIVIIIVAAAAGFAGFRFLLGHK